MPNGRKTFLYAAVLLSLCGGVFAQAPSEPYLMRRTYTHFKPDDPNAVPRFRMFEADTASGLDYFEWKVAQNMKAIVRLAWPDTIPSADQTLVALNDSTLGWSTPAGSGDITAVFTGSGLSGGGPAGSLTLAVKLKLENATLDFTSDSLHVKALGITAAELAANAVTQPKLVLGTGAGDASTLTLHDLISGTPDIGEAIQWDGNNWIPAAVGGSITVREVDGSPSIGSIATIEFLQSDGFTVTDQTGGVARIAFTETGDISGVTAGTGLSGGGSLGAVSIAADSTSWLATDYQVSLRQAKSDTNTYDATKTFVLSQGFLTSETGDISGVTAGAGLSGGGTSGAVTLDINLKLAGTGLLVITSDSLHIKSGGVSTTEIADGTITGDDLNASIAGSGLVLTAGSPDILDFAPSELTNITFGNGGAATGSITFDLTAGDPTITFGNAVVNVSSGTLQQGGTAVVLQSRTVGTTSPLAGGGALSGDLTLSITANGINATHIDETVQYNFSHASNQFRAALFHGDSLRFYDNGGIKAEDDTLYFFTAGGDVAFKLLLSDAPSNSDVLKISNDNVASWQPDAGGETNTASNLGGGLANYDSKSGVDLRFNTFAAADFDLAANVITIDDTKWAKDSELHSAVTLGTDADVLLGLSTQQLTLDAQNANIVFAGPASGGATDPTFRALVDDDIPNDITITGLSGTNTGDVSLAGTPDYITISGQTITRNPLDIADDLNTFASSALFGRLTDETGSASGSPLAVFNQNPTFAGATVSGGNFAFSDGSGDSPLAVFTPETATAWNIGATESNGDFNIFSASTASTENVNISNPGAGAATLTVEGAISASNFSGSSSGTNTGDEALSTSSAGLDVSDHAVDLDVTPSSGSATLEQSEDALQVKYDSEAFGEGASGLTIAAGGIDGGAGGDIADGSIIADDLANAAVSNAKLANMAQNTIKMRVASGAGVPEDIDISSGLALVTAASGDFVIIEDATDGGLKRVDASDFLGGGGAPTDATYITQTANGSLSAEQALGTLASGMLSSTTTTGVVASRVLTGTAGGVEISNGDGSGNPTFTLPSAVTVPTSYAIGSDPADAGVIRLENAAVIAWESAPASTDLTLGVDANEILQSSANFNAPVLTEGTNAVPNATDHLGFFAATTSAQLRGVLSDETGGTGVAVFNSNPTLAGATLSGGNLALSDGAGDSPQATFTPQTGTAWALYVEDTADDFQIEVNTGSAETLDIVNIGAGTINLNIDGTITASNFSGSSSGTNTGDDDVDDEAIHDNVSGEIAAITAKATPTISDFLLIEDAAASNAKKSITLGAMEAALEGVLDLDELQGNLTGSKVNFADTDANWTATNVQAALEEMDDVINGGVPNSATAKVDWSQLANVPAGFADGTDDGSGGGSWSDLTAPTAAVSMVSDGTSETATFDFQAAFTTGNQFTIKQTTGNPSGGSLFAVQAADANVSPIALIENTAAVTIPIALQISATNASGVITTAIDMSDGEIVTALAIGSNDVTVGGATISSAEFAALDDGIALTTETSGSYVASVATTSPLAGGAAGSEGATLTLSISADGINATHIDETVAYAWSGASTVTGSMQFDGDALRILDTGTDHYLTITPGTNLSANRVLTITTGDAARNLTFAGDATISGTNSGDQTITLTGNVTGSGTGSFAATIAEDVVTAAMMANGSHGAFTYTTNVAALNAGSVSGGSGGIITDGSITADDLGTNSVGADELQADALLWNEIGDAGADATIALGANETDFTSTIDAAGEAVFTITNTDADAANDNSFIDLRHNDGADANVFYLRLIGDNDGSPITDYSLSQTAFLIGAGITTTFSGSVSASALTEGANAVPNATDHLGFFAATTSAQLFGVLSDETGGTGVVVGNISPTISTSLSQDGDVADAGYLRLQNAAIIGWEAAPAGTDITLTVDASEIMQASGTFNAATLTEATNAVPNATDHLGFFAATTSAQLAGVLSDEEGSGGGFVRATSPTITTPTISGAIAFPDGVRQTFNPDGTNAGINVGSQAGDPSSPSNGDLWYDSSANELTARINGANVALGAGGSSDIVRSWTLENPTGAENFGAITFPFAVTVVEVRAVLVGSATPSVTINFSHGSDRSGSGATNLFSSGQAITSTTTGHTLSSFNDATVAADEWFWFTTSAQSGTVSEIVVSVHFTVD